MRLAQAWSAILLLNVAAVTGCGAQSTPPESDGDVDSDADSDGDGDTDSGGDADTDADGDAEPLVVEPSCVFPTRNGPEVVGSIDLIPDWEQGVKGFPDHFQLDVVGDLAVVNLDLGGFALVDVSDRTAPVVVGGVDIQNPSWGGLALVGHHVLAVGEPAGGALDETFAFNVFDITDVAAPIFEGQVGLEYPPRVVELLDTQTAIVGLGGTEDAGLHIVDFANPAAPRIVASAAPYPTGAIAVIDDLVVTAGGPRLELFDVSGHRQLSAVDFADFSCADVVASATDVFALWQAGQATISLFQVDDPPALDVSWSVQQPDLEWTTLAVTGGVLVAGGQSTLQTIDLRLGYSANDGVPSGFVEVPAQAPIKRLIARGRYVYVLTGDLRLSVVDLHCEMP